MKRVLIVRPDRLGDVILSTPVIQTLKVLRPEIEISAWVQPALVPLLESCPDLKQVIAFSETESINQWTRQIKKLKFDAALVLQSKSAHVFALRRAGIPIVIGQYSRWFSYLFLTSGIRQRRSLALRHEADYGLELLEKLLGQKVVEPLLPKVWVKPHVIKSAARWIESQPELRGGGTVIAIHPGMGGSALNWDLQNYFELAERLLKDGLKVLFTVGPSDFVEWEAVKQRFLGRAAIFRGSQAEGLDFLAGLYAGVSGVVAPSTGPLHLASAMGCSTVSVYSPIRVHHPRRWGPWPPGQTRNQVLLPKVNCPAKFKCWKERCPEFDCMKKITVESCLVAIYQVVEKKKA